MEGKEVTSESLPSIISLLKDCKLPFEDLTLSDSLIVGYYNEQGKLIGSGGLEFFGDSALLRSIAVSASERGKSIGKEIVNDMIKRGRERGVSDVFLLTETAHDFFLHFGFKDTIRSKVPAPVQRSSEFSSVCPKSASCMVLAVKQT